jgi:uncharacterized protein with von Willebrand factor type A (vWA) domain
MIDVLAGFIQELRRAGLPVSLTENLDATEAVTHVPLEDREAFRYALAATLVKSSAHWKTFETVFDVYFSIRGPQLPVEPPAPADDGGGEERPEDLAEMLYLALRDADNEALRAIARHAVARHAGMEPGRRVGASYYLYRTLRRLELDGLLERLVAEVQADTSGGLSALDERLAREEYASRADDFRREVEAEILRRLVADRGAGPLARTLRRPLPEEIDFMHATGEELAMLRRAVHPLARRLAVRLARKRRHRRRGALDFRNTIRHSLSYGGVPAEPKFRHPRPARPEIMLIADVSGSVAAFARFTLQFVYAISAQFSKVRSFVFIDGIDEVTRFFQGEEDIAAAVHRVNTEADVVWLDGHSDYGHALETFWDRWGQEVGPRTTVILLGDARNNYHASSAWVLKEVRERARHLYWLNPEPRSYWDTGDSIASEFGTHCDGVFECRNLKQLERFVEHLA